MKKDIQIWRRAVLLLTTIVMISAIVWMILIVGAYFKSKVEGAGSGSALIKTGNVLPTKSETLQVKPVESVEAVNMVEGDRYLVSKVVDGDTIDVIRNGVIERVRLIGINTPETVDPRKLKECFGVEASNKAKEILSGKEVILKNDPTQDNKDKYGRILRYVFLEDDINFNEYMVREGFAFEYTYKKPYQYQSDFKKVETEAKKLMKGLWSESTCNGRP